MRTQEDAQTKILALWPKWAEQHKIEKGSGADGLAFFTYLQRERSDLLEFRSAANDKWSLVSTWLSKAKFIP